jgi:hypothetical protein
MTNRSALISVSALETVSYPMQCVSKPLLQAPHRQLLAIYWNSTMQQNNIRSITFKARMKDILKAV